jgi:putative phosphoribosyl transferase
MRLFRNRRDAGDALAKWLIQYAGRGDVVVLGLPRGGVPVAYEVARRLGAPLDIFVVRKLGVPGFEELAMGAIASGGAVVVNRDVVDGYRIPDEVIEASAADERREIARREHLYRGDRPRLELAGRTVILVDDGLATGATMAAAVSAIRQERPARVVVAVPVGAASTVAEMRSTADDVVCVEVPESFSAVGEWYANFDQTTDEEVRELLDDAGASSNDSNEPRPTRVSIPSAPVNLCGDLAVPPIASAMVLFAHGAGSSRKSPRNQFVAQRLNEAGFATLLMDLLTEEEDTSTAEPPFHVELLAGRLMDATDWLMGQPSLRKLEIGYFGASTGAAAALTAAAWRPDDVKAIVSRGGRPDLAGAVLLQVRAPTLLVVGGDDGLVVDMNRDAFAQLRCEKRLELVPGATHLFEEPGALSHVADVARDWFNEHLGVGAPGRSAAPWRRSPERRKDG